MPSISFSIGMVPPILIGSRVPDRFRLFKQDQHFPENFSATLQQLNEALPEDNVTVTLHLSAPHVSQQPLHFPLDLSGLLLKRFSPGCHRTNDISHASCSPVFRTAPWPRQLIPAWGEITARRLTCE
jgi:hypothetical protein